MLSLLSLISCATPANFIPYSSAYTPVQSSSIRTELTIIQGDNKDLNSTRGYSIVSAVDIHKNGDKKNYLLIVPSFSSDLTLQNLLLNYNYPYFISINDTIDLIKNLNQTINEWDAKNNFNGAVYTFNVNTSDITIFENLYYKQANKFFIKFDYSKNEVGSIAKIDLGVVQSVINYSSDGKKDEIMRSAYPITNHSYNLDTKDKVIDFRDLLRKGIAGLNIK